MRLVFLGSPSFAVPSLEALREAGHEIGLVVTQPDRPSGRGQKPTPSPVAAYAREHGLPVWQTSSLRGPEAEARLREVGADAMALAAFAALVPGNVLALTPLGILNVHPSLLPRWRGAAPIQAALLAGDTETGVSIIRLVQALDAGASTAAGARADRARGRLPDAGAAPGSAWRPLLVRALAEQPQGSPRTKRRHVLAPHRTRRCAHRLDPARREIWNQVRAYRAWPQLHHLRGPPKQSARLAARPKPCRPLPCGRHFLLGGKYFGRERNRVDPLSARGSSSPGENTSAVSGNRVDPLSAGGSSSPGEITSAASGNRVDPLSAGGSSLPENTSAASGNRVDPLSARGSSFPGENTSAASGNRVEPLSAGGSSFPGENSSLALRTEKLLPGSVGIAGWLAGGPTGDGLLRLDDVQLGRASG